MWGCCVFNGDLYMGVMCYWGGAYLGVLMGERLAYVWCVFNGNGA